MKNVKKVLFAAIVALSINVTTQAQKVAHIEVQTLVTSMPEFKKAQEDLKKLSDGFEKDLKKMVEDFQAKYKKYGEEAKTSSEALNETRSRELQDAQQRIAQFEQNAAMEISKKRESLQLPILEKAQKAIQKVAREKGFEYVLDSTVGAGVVLADGPDLMNDVKKELKIK